MDSNERLFGRVDELDEDGLGGVFGGLVNPLFAGRQLLPPGFNDHRD